MLISMVRKMAIARGAFAFNIARYSSHSDSPPPQQQQKTLVNVCENSLSPTTALDEKKNDVTLKESDFEEKFVRGSGPGGQKVNKSSNCVELKHKETGIVVKCHETRSREKNREIARMRLLEQLKRFFTPSESSLQKKIDEKRKRDGQAARRRRLKEESRNNKIDL